MIGFIVNSNLFKHPDLVLAAPLSPESDGNSICRISVVRQVNVGVASVDEDSTT